MTEKYASIDMDLWPDTWQEIKSKLKNPDTHIESGWLEDIFEKIDITDHEITEYSYEISARYTPDGIPVHVDVPIKWENAT